ncbi:MAG: SH3 domain-containing protein [Caldilinea sp. CFX5]|nr:SH3 domain-containing protein [Caldilinea sp. CFX5]
MAILLLLAFFIAACGGDEEPPATPVDATPAAGGMVVPTAAADQAQAAVTPTPALLIGDAVQVLPDQQLRLYTDATTDALVMNVYASGERFMLLDASGDYTVYPVEQGGRRWYRLRAADGLVGWGDAAQLAPVN